MTDFQQQMDDMIDATPGFGEKARVVPYRKRGRLAAFDIDPSRQPADVVGLVYGKGFMVGSVGTPAMLQKRGEADLIYSLQDKYSDTIQVGDHVIFTNLKRKGLECEVTYIEPGVNGRDLVHLIRVSK